MEAREEKREIAFPKVSSLFDSINGYTVVHIFWARGGELTFWEQENAQVNTMGAGGAQEVGEVGEQEEGAGKEYRIKGKLHLIMEKVDSRGDLHQEITHSRWWDRCVCVYVCMYAH